MILRALLIVLLGVSEGSRLRGKSSAAPAPAELWKTSGNQSGAKMYEWLPSNVRAAAAPYNNDPKAMGINAAALEIINRAT